MAKGVMFALTTVFLAGVIIVLSLLIFRVSLDSEARASELSLMHRLYDLDQSLQSIIRDTYTSNGLTTTSTNRSISIIQELPSANSSTINATLTNLKTFVEHDEPAVRFNLATPNTRPFIILPYHVNYSRPDNRSIRIIPLLFNYDAYTFTFSTNNKPLGTILWDTFESGTFPITITTTNTTHTQTSTQTIDMSKELDVRIQGISSGEIRIEMDDDDNQIDITSTLNVPVQSNTTIRFGSGTTRPYLALPNLYTITFPEFNVSKTSGVLLTTFS